MGAVVFYRGNASTHLVKASMTTRTYVLVCLSVSGNDPMMSHDISKGWLACVVPSGACG